MNKKTDATHLPIAVSILVVIFLLRFLPLIVDVDRLWGINHLRFIPDAYKAVFLLSGLLAFIILVPSLNRAVLKLYGNVAEMLMVKNRHIAWSLLCGLSVLVFWILKPELYFLGDSFQVVGNFASGHPVDVKWTETGAVHAAQLIAYLLPESIQDIGRMAYAFLSVLSGGIFIFVLLSLSRMLGEDSLQRFGLFILLLFGGWLLLFFGYTENYPVLWPFVGLYLLFALRYLRGTGRIWPVMLLLALSIYIHMQSIILVPSLLYLFICRGKGRKWFNEFRKVILISAGILVMASCVLLVRDILMNPELSLILIPFIDGRPPVAYYTLFSKAHIFDILNFLLLVSPLFLVLIYFARKEMKAIVQNGEHIFLGLAALAGLIFLVLLDPKLGMARDWDLFALAGFLLTLFLLNLIKDKVDKKLIPTLSMLSVLLAFPFIATHLSVPTAAASIESLFNLDIHRSRSGIVYLMHHYRFHGEERKVDSLETVLMRTFPSYRLQPLADSLLGAGEFDRAKICIDSLVAYDPYSSETLLLEGTYFINTGERSKAIDKFDQVAKLGRYNSKLMILMASAYWLADERDRAMNILRHEYSKDPNDSLVLNHLYSVFIQQQQHDSALFYAQKYLQQNPSVVDAYIVAGVSAYHIGDQTLAKRYFTKFLELAPSHPQAEEVRQLLNK